MEITAQLFRALASHVRIRIIRVLAVLGERRVNELADAVGLCPCTVSSHLKTRAASGLVWRRRSGRVVYYRVAEEPANSLTREVLSLLSRVFRHVKARDPELVAASDQTASPSRSDAALFSCFTAFTHPRRLQIVRDLQEHGETTLDTLVQRLSMSPQACSRHVSKLTRRGLIVTRKAGREVAARLASGAGPVQRDLMGAVMRKLGCG